MTSSPAAHTHLSFTLLPLCSAAGNKEKQLCESFKSLCSEKVSCAHLKEMGKAPVLSHGDGISSYFLGSGEGLKERYVYAAGEGSIAKVAKVQVCFQVDLYVF